MFFSTVRASPPPPNPEAEQSLFCAVSFLQPTLYSTPLIGLQLGEVLTTIALRHPGGTASKRNARKHAISLLHSAKAQHFSTGIVKRAEPGFAASSPQYPVSVVDEPAEQTALLWSGRRGEMH